MADVNVWGIVSIVLFYAVIFAIGLWAGWKSKSFQKGATSEDLMLAGRSIGPFVGIFTLTATWVGGGYINGTAEYVFTPGYGLIWTVAPVGYAISLVIGGLLFAGKMRSQGYVTMLDPFYQRYGPIVTALLYIPAFLGDLFWSAAILSALGSSLAVVVGLDTSISIIISAAIAIFYTLFGGLYSVAYTDVIQLIFIWIGLYLSFPFAMYHDAVSDVSSTAYDLLSNSITTALNTTMSSNTSYTAYLGKWIGYDNVNKDNAGIYADGFLLLIFGGIPWQVYFQRVLSAKSAKIAKALSLVAAVGCLFSAVPAVMIGAIAASTDWSKTGFSSQLVDGQIPAERYREILPLVLQYLCPPAVAFIGLGAVSAAVMSSTDSSILSASSMFSRNVYKPFRSLCGKPSERELIWVMRVFVLFIGAMATIMAIEVTSTYELWFLCSDLVYVILFPQLLCIIYVPFSNGYGAVVAYVLGWILRLGGGEPLIKLKPFIKYPMFDEENSVQQFPFKTFVMVINVVTIILVSYIANYLFKSGAIPSEADIFQMNGCRPEQDADDSNDKGSTEELEEKRGPPPAYATENLGYTGSKNSIETRL